MRERVWQGLPLCACVYVMTDPVNRTCGVEHNGEDRCYHSKVGVEQQLALIRMADEEHKLTPTCDIFKLKMNLMNSHVSNMGQ